MIRFEIDGKPIDLDPRELPGFYYALQDLIDLDALKGSRSTTMQLPATDQVRAALGGWSIAEEFDERPLDFKVTTGSAVIFSGKAKVISRSANTYEVVAVGNNAAWKDAAGSLSLRQVDMGLTPNITAAYQEATWTDEDNIVYFPLIDYGGLTSRPYLYNVTPQSLRPALRVWHVLRKAFAQLGYSIEAKRGLAANCKKFVLPNTTTNTFSQSDNVFAEVLRMSRQGAQPNTWDLQPVNAAFAGTPIQLDLPTFTGPSYATPGSFEPATDCQVRVELGLHWAVDSWVGPFLNQQGAVQYTLNAAIYDFTASEIVSTTTPIFRQHIVASNYSPIPQSAIRDFAEFTAVAGHTYGICLFSPQWNYFVAGGPLYGTVQSDSIRTLEATYASWQSSTQFYTTGFPLVVNTAAPDISVLDLVKWWTINQNIVVRTDEITKHVTFEYYDDFCRPIDEGLDWTYRIDHSDPPRKVTDVLPRAYNFRFEEDSDDIGVFEINKGREGLAPYGGHNEPLPTGQESALDVTIGFAPTEMVASLDKFLYIPRLLSKESEQDAQGFYSNYYDHAPRLLYADGLELGNWSFNNVTVEEYPRCYFIWGEAGRVNIAFGNEAQEGGLATGSVATRWRNRLRRSTAPTVEGFLRLHDYELTDFDFGKPLYMNDGHHGSWFYLIEIKRHQFLADATTEVKLVRV